MAMISTAAWRTGGAFMAHRGHQVFWREAGPPQAPVLLLIHGFPTSSWDWEAIWPTLSQHYRLLAVDMMGFGFSDKPADYDYSILDQADIHDALLALCAVREFHILAHDYGDSVAQELIARDQELKPGKTRPRLLSATLLNGGLFPETHRPLLIQKLLLSPIGPMLARGMNRAKLGRSLRRIFGKATPPSEALLQGFWELVSHNQGQRAVPRLISYIPERRLRRARWVGGLQTTRVPLKLINGPDDPISGAHMVERYRALLPRPDVTELPGIGHYPQVEAPQALLEAFLSFQGSLR
jgi:pimeloyl-ACP methyl ester carboxylesterase